ncbi:cell division protein FtsL [Paracoccus kondratievae]
MSSIQRQIGRLREDLGVLRAEWAFLNRPERLRQLVDLNFDRLKLVPFGSDQFVDVGQIAFPTATPQTSAPGENPPVERPAGYPPRRPQESTP